MEIKQQYLNKYLPSIAIEQIADEYREKGYQVSFEEEIGKNHRADLVARNDKDTIVIEVKSGEISPERKKEIAELADYVREKHNYKFLVVIAKPPKDKELIIGNLEQLLTEYLGENHYSELDNLSTHTSIEEVSGIEIDQISIGADGIFVAGDAVVSVQLQYGSNMDQHANGANEGAIIYDSFTFEFEVILKYDANRELRISQIKELAIDTSSYY